MNPARSRRFQPLLHPVEPRILLSGKGAATAAMPTQGLVDLKPTELTTDLRDALIRSTPHDGRQGWSINLLKVDPSTRLVYGGLTLLYRSKPFSGIAVKWSQRVKVKVDIAFITNLDAPNIHDVKVVVSRDINSFGPNVRHTIALGIISFLKADHHLISNSLPTANKPPT